MRSFQVPNLTPPELVAKVRSGLAARGYDRQVSVRLDGDRLTIEFRWMGTSSFEYTVLETAGGFRAELASRRVSPLHVAFADRFDHYFERALTELGATTV
jgi:hypothetical protein